MPYSEQDARQEARADAIYQRTTSNIARRYSKRRNQEVLARTLGLPANIDPTEIAKEVEKRGGMEAVQQQVSQQMGQQQGAQTKAFNDSRAGVLGVTPQSDPPAITPAIAPPQSASPGVNATTPAPGATAPSVGGIQPYDPNRMISSSTDLADDEEIGPDGKVRKKWSITSSDSNAGIGGLPSASGKMRRQRALPYTA